MTAGNHASRSTVSPFLVLLDPEKTIAFLQTVFDARLVAPPLRRADGSIWNAEIGLGDSTIFVSGAGSENEVHAGFVHVYVDECDAVYQRALAEGASSMMEPADQFYGDRSGGVMDSCGTIWWIATHKENLTQDELETRARKVEAARAAGSGGGGGNG